MTIDSDIDQFVDRDFARETDFLAELVKVPSDNPPGDCAAHAARAKDCWKTSASRSRRTRCLMLRCVRSACAAPPI